MLFLSNVTVAHAGRYECKALNPGGVAHMTFHLAINMTSSTALWPRLHSSSSSSLYLGEVVGVSQEPLYEMESMDFSALGPATQTVIAVGISLLALIALLLLIMIYSRQQQHKQPDDSSKEERILHVNNYSDGPSTSSQLEEYCDDAGHEMYVLNCSRSGPALPTHAGLLANQHAASLANQHTGVLANQQGVLVLQEGIHAQVWKVKNLLHSAK
ncbi:leucine-rich repeat-containing protein 24-like [Coregonus clupeaformis]|uniref:leucine-rich repeat-containing protein 24-like n=1 Tax=Coregonus clupeaformis TaxID=59861 RepID=UPI001BE091FD|nr:leucine-rich repeat-containing protein 24-like [Coregonus clupeaformis]